MQYFQQPTTMFEGFGMNPAYATPAYMSNFRPAYAADQDQDNAYARDFQYSDAIKESVFLKGTDAGFNTDPAQYMASRHKAIWDSHSDAVAQGITYVGAPLAAWYLANKVLGKSATFSTGSKFVNPVTAAWQHSKIKAAGLAAGATQSTIAAQMAGATVRQSMGTMLGTGLGRMAGGAMGGAIGLGARALGFGGFAGAGMLAGGGAVAGAMLGSFALPLIAGTAMSKAANEFISDPYVAVRRGSDAWLANTANTYVGGASQPYYGGFGVSHTASHNLSSSLVRASNKDRAFDRQTYNILADYGMQEGLFNDIGNLNTNDVTKRVEKMADSVRAIMAIANTPSVKEAVKYLGKAKSMGISDPIEASRFIARIGTAGALSGSSVDQIMNTVGIQGQYLYQQSGLMPSIGQTTAATMYGGFANAYKKGLLSTETMASLGGLEGMTQNAMQANMTMLNNPLFRMAIQSGQGGDIGQKGFLSMLSTASQRFSKDPTGYLGLSALNSNIDTSMLASEGPIQTLIKSKDTLREQGYAHLVNFQGDKANFVQTMGVLKSQGMSESEIRALYEQARIAVDPNAKARAREVIMAQFDKTSQQQRSQMDIFENSNLPIIGDANVTFKNWGKRMDAAGNSIGSGLSYVSASLSDVMNKANSYSAGVRQLRDREVTNVRTDTGIDGKLNRQYIDTMDFKFLRREEYQDHRLSIKKADGSSYYTGREIENAGLDDLKTSIKGVLTNYDKDSSEYKQVTSLLDKMKNYDAKGISSAIDALQKSTKNGFLTGRNGETAVETKNRILKELSDSRVQISKKTIAVDRLNDDTTRHIMENIDNGGSVDKSAWRSAMDYVNPFSEGYNVLNNMHPLGMISGVKGMIDRRAQYGDKDTQEFMSDRGEGIVLRSTLQSNLSGESTDSYYSLLDRVLNDKETKALAGKKYESLTDDEKRKVDERRALLTYSNIKGEDKDIFDNLSGRDDLTAKEALQLNEVLETAAENFDSNIDGRYKSGMFDKRAVSNTLRSMGKMVNGKTAFDDLEEGSFYNNVGLNEGRVQVIRDLATNFDNAQRAAGALETDAKDIKKNFYNLDDPAIKDFVEVTKHSTAIQEEYAKTASGLNDAMYKLYGVIGQGTESNNLTSALDKVNKNLTSLNQNFNNSVVDTPMNRKNPFKPWPGSQTNTGKN